MLGQIIVSTGILLAAAGSGDPAPGRAPGSASPPEAHLNMPPRATERMPELLSPTGAFSDTPALAIAPGLIPYELNTPFRSDGAEKRRWIAMPADGGRNRPRIRFSPRGEGRFPTGTVFVKHFDLPIDETRPDHRRRLETRLLLRDDSGISYRWRADRSDSDLVKEGRREAITIRTATGVRTQNWYFPGPADCRQCHTPAASGVLGVNTRQLNRGRTDPSGKTENQLRTWSHLGRFEPAPAEAKITRLARLAPLGDTSRSPEDRARSFLDANCSQCHRPGGVAAVLDARYDAPLSRQGLIHFPARIDLAVDGARLIAPNDPWRSTILGRVETLEATRMPPLAHEVVDRRAAALLRARIANLPGPAVDEPPAIESA